MKYISEKETPSMIHDLATYDQKAFEVYQKTAKNKKIPVTDLLCESVFSIPMYTELTEDSQKYICNTILNYLN